MVSFGMKFLKSEEGSYAAKIIFITTTTRARRQWP
jgi:hypothetical protein